MCILFIAVNQHPDYPLVIAANRDEFHNRPTQESHFWQQSPTLLAGKDLRAGGTWMGVNRRGKLAALTNVRDPQQLIPNATSRGELVSHFLQTAPSNQSYLHQLRHTRGQYNGYNLLFGDWQNLWVYNNHTDKNTKLEDGFYGLSNADLNSAWPKINNGVAKLREHCQQPGEINTDKLFDILLNQQQASDELLPQTGVPVEWERKLSSIFIKSPDYGTRSATLLLVDQKQRLTWREHTFNPEAMVVNEQEYTFTLEQ